jgi:hypothetical protein
MRDSNVANAAKESAQTEFPHGLLDFCQRSRKVADGTWPRFRRPDRNEHFASRTDRAPSRGGPVHEFARVPRRIDDCHIEAAFWHVARKRVGNKLIVNLLDWLPVYQQDSSAGRLNPPRHRRHPERQYVLSPHKFA